MGAPLEDAALVEDDDLVGPLHGAQAVGDHQGGAAGEEAFEGVLDEAFGLGVEGGGGFVEDEDGRVAQYGPGDGEALPLAAGEFAAPVTDVGTVAIRRGEDEVVSVSDPRRFVDLRLGDARQPENDVVVDRIVEEDGLLGDDTEVGAYVRQGELPQVGAVEGDRSGRRVVEAGEEIGDGGFAAAGVAHQRYDLAPGQVEVNSAQDLRPIGGISKTDVL